MELKKYMQKLIMESINEDFWIESIERNFLQRRLRSVILNFGCISDIPSYRTKVYELFKTFLDNNVKPNSDIRSSVYYYGIYNFKLILMFIVVVTQNILICLIYSVVLFISKI